MGVLRNLRLNSAAFIYSVPFTNRVNIDVPLTTTPVRVCPGILGGEEWNGSAYYAKDSLLIVPATDWCAEVSKDTTAPDPEREHSRGAYIGGQTKFEPWSAARGRLTAFDASTGHEKWRYDAAKPLVAGVTTTAGDLVFTGEFDWRSACVERQIGRGAAAARTGWSGRWRCRHLPRSWRAERGGRLGFRRSIQPIRSRNWRRQYHRHGLPTPRKLSPTGE